MGQSHWTFNRLVGEKWCRTLLCSRGSSVYGPLRRRPVDIRERERKGKSEMTNSQMHRVLGPFNIQYLVLPFVSSRLMVSLRIVIMPLSVSSERPCR